MKRILSLMLAASLLFSLSSTARAETLSVDAAACLLMEKTTGEILYAVNEHEQYEPASVTKIMTILLVMEAIDEGRIKLTDTVTAAGYQVVSVQ